MRDHWNACSCPRREHLLRFRTLVKSCKQELSVIFFFFIWGWFVKTRCWVAPIPRTAAAAAEAAVLHHHACLQDFQGSAGPSVGTSGSNLSHRHHTLFLHKIPLTLGLHMWKHTVCAHACMWLSLILSGAPTDITSDPRQPLIKMWRLAYCSPPFFPVLSAIDFPGLI